MREAVEYEVANQRWDATPEGAVRRISGLKKMLAGHRPENCGGVDCVLCHPERS